MRKNREILWLIAVVVLVALGTRWMNSRGKHEPSPTTRTAQVWKGARAATVVPVGEAFELKVHGAGALMFRPHRDGGVETVSKAYLTVDPGDGDLIRVDDRAHLYPKVQLRMQAKTLEILPDGHVLAGAQDGTMYEVGRIFLKAGASIKGDEPDPSVHAPGEAGTGQLLVYPAPTPVPGSMYKRPQASSAASVSHAIQQEIRRSYGDAPLCFNREVDLSR